MGLRVLDRFHEWIAHLAISPEPVPHSRARAVAPGQADVPYDPNALAAPLDAPDGCGHVREYYFKVIRALTFLAQRTKGSN